MPVFKWVVLTDDRPEDEVAAQPSDNLIAAHLEMSLDDQHESGFEVITKKAKVILGSKNTLIKFILSFLVCLQTAQMKMNGLRVKLIFNIFYIAKKLNLILIPLVDCFFVPNQNLNKLIFFQCIYLYEITTNLLFDLCV